MIHTIFDPDILNRIHWLIERADNIVITCHKSPDGDAIGSSLALCHVLRKLGKNASVVVPDMVPRTLHFLPMMRDVTVYSKAEPRAKRIVGEAQLIFCLDFNSMSRIDKLGALIAESQAPRVLIDHHLDPNSTAFAQMLSFHEASSTCELVYRFLCESGFGRYIDRIAAECIYVGIMTDTGNFTYSSSNPELYEIVANLMSYGIDKEQLYKLAMNTFSADTVRLQGYALSEKMQIFADKGMALITLTKDELARFHYRKGDTEGLVNKPLAIPEVNRVIFMREDAECIKVSCRSQGEYSVNEICQRHFNGGGHRNAAGGDFYGSMEEALTVFFSILSQLDNEQTETNQ